MGFSHIRVDNAIPVRAVNNYVSMFKRTELLIKNHENSRSITAA